MPDKPKIQSSWTGVLVWNNHFYGICIVGLAICSSLYLTDQLPSIIFLTIAYLTTVVYYTNAYFNEPVNEENHDRTAWYQMHQTYLKKRQWFFSTALLILGALFIFEHPTILHLDLIALLCLLMSAIGSFLYNRTNFKKHGFLKSAFIAFVWTIVGGYLPLYFNKVLGYPSVVTKTLQFVYLLQMFLFIFLLAALFDIKDMKKDLLSEVQTIPIRIGLNNITSRLTLPILISYSLLDMLQARAYHFTLAVWILHVLFYFLVYFASKLAIQENKILRSILLIDGLMILRALVGISTWYWTQGSK
jgi:hypothetical protein